MESNWRNYFTFTKKERTGIYVLIGLIIVCTLIPRLFYTPDPGKQVIIQAMTLQKAPSRAVSEQQPSAYHEMYLPKQEEALPPAPAELFAFDPNTLDAAGWKRLGLRERTIKTILNYKAKGGQFRSAADLQRIYGLPPADAARLQPYVHIERPAAAMKYDNSAPVKYVKAPPTILDINQADTAAFIALPGIGSKLANRIVNFREKLGGFYSVEQMGETWGLPDSTFQLLKSRLQCTPTAVQKININTADAGTLKQHPYIKWNIANAIVQYRQQHGAFREPAELQQIMLITPELFQKMAAYIAVE